MRSSLRSALSLLTTIMLACAEDRPPVEVEGSSLTVVGRHESEDVHPIGSPCTARAPVTCRVWLATHGRVTDCAVGTQRCIEGAWGRCEGPLRRA